MAVAAKPAGRQRRRVELVPDPPQAIARRLSRMTIDQLCQAYLAGATCNELANRHRISKTSVQNLLRHEGIQLRRQSPTPHQVDEAIALYQLGRSLMTIGAKLEVAPSTIYRALTKAGVAMRDPQGRLR